MERTQSASVSVPVVAEALRSGDQDRGLRVCGGALPYALPPARAGRNRHGVAPFHRQRASGNALSPYFAEPQPTTRVTKTPGEVNLTRLPRW